MGQVYVEIFNMNTGEVASRMGPMSERKADRVEMGALHRIDLDNWSVRTVPAENEAEASQ